MDDAVQALFGHARDATERTYAKLLLGALGLFPAGTLVELTTGELAVVTATPRLPIDFARPPVRVLYDADANLLEDPVDVDLAAPPPPGQAPRLIKRAVDADEQQMRQMRAYVAGLSTAASRTPRRDAVPPAAPAAARPPTGQAAARAAATVPPGRPSAAAQGAVTERPRRDERADERAPRPEVSGPRSSAPESARAAEPAAPAPPEGAPRRASEVAFTPPRPSTGGVSTRAMAWEQYGQLVDETQPVPRRRTTPPAAPEATDALLAAYLDETPSRGGSSHGLRGWGNDPASARDSSRADPASSGDRASASGPPSAGGDPSSAGIGSRAREGWAVPPSRRAAWGGSPSSRRTDWSAAPSSRRADWSTSPSSRRAEWSSRPPGSAPPAPSDAPPRSRALSGRSRTSTVDWTAGPRAPTSTRSSRPPPRPSSSRPPAAPPPRDEPPSTGRKPKAGTGGWGADRK
jgi:hypothetical protein